jgi:mannose-6-phosphate isomerase-like protein (cupin superfamily)
VIFGRSRDPEISIVIAGSDRMQKFFSPAAAILLAAVLVTPALGQTPAAPAARPPAQTPPPAAPASATPRPAAPRPRPTTPVAQIVVRDNSGTGLEGVKIAVTGPTSLQATTDAKGVSTATLPPGTYRFRFERADFVTLERDVTVRAGQPTEVAVALNLAPPPPAPVALPPPPPPPPPAPKAAAPSGPPSSLSILQFLEKNYIGRDPLKESVLGCTGAATTRLLQLRDSLASHTHAESDEIIYVVAGEGMARVGDQMMPLAPGTLTVIPRGLAHATERRGKSPLILLSTLAGAPCPSAPNGP